MIKIEVSCINKADLLSFERELNKIQGITIDKIEQSGFDGLDLVYFFISTGGTAYLISSIKEVIIKALDNNKDNLIVVDGVLLKGYSRNDAEKLLDNILNKTND